jgi:hypothetical protein
MDRIAELGGELSHCKELLSSACSSAGYHRREALQLTKKLKEQSLVVAMLNGQIEELRGIISGKKPTEE